MPVSITAANVAKGSDAVTRTDIAGATITAGQPVYQAAADSLISPADANAAVGLSVCVGIALNGATAGQPITYQSAGSLTTGHTMTVGEIYVLSATAGGIDAVGSLVTSSYTTILYVATSTTVAKMCLFNSSALHG